MPCLAMSVSSWRLTSLALLAYVAAKAADASQYGPISWAVASACAWVGFLVARGAPRAGHGVQRCVQGGELRRLLP